MHMHQWPQQSLHGIQKNHQLTHHHKCGYDIILFPFLLKEFIFHHYSKNSLMQELRHDFFV